MRSVLLSAAAIGAFGAFAVPASAADVQIENFTFSPTPVTIAQGETVTWHFAGPDTNHSVTSDPNQADSFDSDPGRTPTSADHLPGSTFDHTFNTPGTFTYLCKVHSFMTGKVVVTNPDGSPPADTTAPAISGLKASGGTKCKPHAKHCKGKPTTLRFTLSEAAQVKVAADGKPKLTLSGRAGANTAKLSTKQLGPGRHALKLVATDAAGNSSPPATAPVKVKRG